MSMLGSIPSLLLPQSCASCGEACSGRIPVCTPCVRLLSPLSAPMCARCGQPLPPTEDAGALCNDCLLNRYAFDRMRSAYAYNEVCKALLTAFKFHARWRLGPYLAAQCAALLPHFPMDEIDLCVSVPSPAHRCLMRPYNPCRFLTHTIAQLTGKPSCPNTLVWKRLRPPQHKLDRRERLSLNASHFWVTRSLEGKTPLLIDDIFTTGATVQACSQALKLAGARAVFVMTVARTPGSLMGR